MDQGNHGESHVFKYQLFIFMNQEDEMAWIESGVLIK
jgi:hypothetical protein